jgi:hypothetical protein
LHELTQNIHVFESSRAVNQFYAPLVEQTFYHYIFVGYLPKKKGASYL